MRKKRGILSSILGNTVGIYLVVTFTIAAPYFNWQYAHRHGFAASFALGGIATTAESFAWPYFAVKSVTSSRASSEVPSTDRAAFTASLTEALKGNAISAKLPNVSREKANDLMRQMADHINKSIALGKGVSDQFLRSLNPALPHQYRTNLMAGQKQYLKGMQNGDVILQAEGINHLQRWKQYVAKNPQALGTEQ